MRRNRLRRAASIWAAGLVLTPLSLIVLTCGTAAGETPPPHVVEHVSAPSFDGVKLDGWIVRPANVPSGSKLPAVLWSAPYFGQCDFYPFPTDDPPPRCHYATGDNPDLWDNDTLSEAVPVDFLLEHGYAVAIFNVRGTGNSEGCFSWLGPQEQKDQAFLVEWLAKQAWSNGNIGMMGLSYHGTTPWEAAIQNPPHLKTIVVAGMIGDAYTFSHTPEGATGPSTIGVFDNNFAIRTTLSPPINASPEHFTIEHFPVLPSRLCPDLARFITDDMSGLATGYRDPSFYEARRLIDRFPQVRAAVFLTHGFQDLWYSGHQFQAAPVWPLLTRAPKRMLQGQWAHAFPNFLGQPPGHEGATLTTAQWDARLLDWLDFWLKGRGHGRAPGEGTVDYEAEAPTGDPEHPFTFKWRKSRAWPPAEAGNEVLYPTPPSSGKSEGSLSGAPGGGSASFRSYPQAEKIAQPALLLCRANLVSDEAGPGGVAYLSDPVQQQTLIAGNPFAYLRVESDLPGGQLSVHLFDVGPDFRCNDDGTVSDARAIATGAADLRFCHGNYVASDFPVNTPTNVRVDITGVAEVLESGHRLGLVVSYGDVLERASQPFYPQIALHADGGLQASQLVVPVVEGSLGGGAPRISYPPRPFIPTAGGGTSGGSGGGVQDGSGGGTPVASLPSLPLLSR
jgi:putative CocE/NonD family hydrolase